MKNIRLTTVFLIASFTGAIIGSLFEQQMLASNCVFYFL